MRNNMSRKKEESRLPSIKNEFLPDEFNTGETSNAYSLEKEFAKSAKNRNYLVYALVILFLGLMLGISVLVSWYVQKRYENQHISFAPITELNLQDLLSKAKQQEKTLEQAKDELVTLKATRDAAIKKAVSDAERQRIEANYQRRIKDKESSIKTMESSVDNYDIQLRETARKADEMANNYKRLAELQMAEEKKKHEAEIREITLRYNPIFTESALNSILKENVSRNNTSVEKNETFDKTMADESILTSAEYSELRRLAGNKDKLIKRMREIPYVNSAGQSMQKIDELDMALSAQYETMRQKMLASIKDKNERLNSYRYAFDSYTRNQAEGGFILDPRNSSKIVVFVNPVYRIQTGDTATVFRNYDEIIGTIEFFYEGKTLMAKPTTLAAGKSIQAMDKIIIQKSN